MGITIEDDGKELEASIPVRSIPRGATFYGRMNRAGAGREGPHVSHFFGITLLRPDTDGHLKTYSRDGTACVFDYTPVELTVHVRGARKGP